MTRKHRDDEQEVENITRNMKRNPARESLRCDWENCGRLCKTQAGLKAHQQMAHREKIVTINCCKCVNSFSYHRVKQITRSCQRTRRGTCAYCLHILSISNMARHKRQCSLFNEVQIGQAYKDKNLVI